jgi:prepilin-type N-terminal cleavage/methylation domain-containing protein
VPDMMHGAKTHRVLSRLRKRGGFTLVEVLAAVLLLSIGLIAVLSAVQACRTTQQRTFYMPIGRNIAQSTIEILRAEPFDTAVGSAGQSTSSLLPKGNTIVLTISPYPTASDTNLYQALVAVSWPEGKGTRTIRYETLLARK